MCFSALVDADYLDTERHFQSDAPRDRGQYPELDWYRDKLSEHMTRLQEKSDGSSVNRARQEILNACVEAAMEPAGAFRLTVPTGGGKTLAGLFCP
jgi:CRISPR-associated endonuclease/helicase Cas3